MVNELPDFLSKPPPPDQEELPYFLQKAPPKRRKLMGKAKFFILAVLGCIIASIILIPYLRDFVVWFIDAKKLWWGGKFYF